MIRFSSSLSRPMSPQVKQIHWSASPAWYRRWSLTLCCTLDPAVPSTPRTAPSLQDQTTWWATTFRDSKIQFFQSYSAVICVSVSIRSLSEFRPRRPWCCLNCRRRAWNWTQLAVWSGIPWTPSRTLPALRLKDQWLGAGPQVQSGPAGTLWAWTNPRSALREKPNFTNKLQVWLH